MTKVVLAFNGDFESSVTLKWLLKRGEEVICFIADVGQEDGVEEVEAKARRLGAEDVRVEDLREELVTQFLFPALKANALYEGKCMVGEALTMTAIAKKQVDIAVDEGTVALCHGAKGKGIAQVRYELVYKSLLPKSQTVSPWKDISSMMTFATSEKLVAESEGLFPAKTSLLQTAYSGSKLEEPHAELGDECYLVTASPYTCPDSPSKVAISFEHGIPTAIEDANGRRIENPLEMISALNELAALHGVGRNDVIVNRLMGLKWREVYEAPAATVLWMAHRDLEGLVLDKQVLGSKEQFTCQIGECLYNGLCFSPEMRLMMAAVEDSQEDLTGKVFIELYKGTCKVIGRESVLSRYCRTLNRLEQIDAFDADDVSGFLNIQSLRLQQRAF